MKSKKLGLYIHIPFCVRKCNYCDFCSFASLDEDVKERYIEKICSEIRSYRGKTENYQIASIFFGGGTPSLLSPDMFYQITEALRETFSLDQSVEFTVEANPKTITREKLSTMISCGVNRLSIGLQSIHVNELKSLGRIHTFQDFLDSYSLARRMGIENINIDLMYAIPEQTRESFKETVDTVVDLCPSHISAYSLIIEDETPFGRMKDSLPLPSEEDEMFMVDYLNQKLAGNGFSHYEISNYAKEGCQSRHNLLYWNMDEYIGIGLSAHTDFDGIRFSNTTDMDEYLSESYIQYRVSECPSEEQRAFEYAMLRLRLKAGLSLNAYQRRFGADFMAGNEEYIKKCVEGGFMLLKGDTLSFTEAGFYVSNEILSSIL